MPLSPSLPALRRQAQTLFQAGIAAADPRLAVRRYLQTHDGRLEIGLDDGSVRCGHWDKIRLIAFGKAACAMASAAIDVLPAQSLSNDALVVTNYDNVAPLAGIDVIGAGHPLPDAAGFDAAQRLARLAEAARPGELVLVLVSGGGSALIPYPVASVSLAEKIATTELLLACGATINEINCVRKHLSQLKGGGLARLAWPADVHALILSDVLGDDLSAIASGPTVPDSSTYRDAVAVLQQRGIWHDAPDSVRRYLEQGCLGHRPETPKPGDAHLHGAGHTLIGSNTLSVAAMQNAAHHLGIATQIYSNRLCGIARDEAERLALYAKTLKQPLAVLAGGETTVRLTGSGRGGRNQEMALAFALAAERHGLTGAWVFLSAGSDGRDGPTDAAGGIVDSDSLARMAGAGCDARARLDDNDSYPALQSSQDLLLTGATGTNVADLQILLIHPHATT